MGRYYTRYDPVEVAHAEYFDRMTSLEESEFQRAHREYFERMTPLFETPATTASRMYHERLLGLRNNLYGEDPY